MTKQGDSMQSSGLDGFYASLRRLGVARSSGDRWFGGVAAGLARWFGVDPLVVRAAFILFGVFFGMGITLYLVLLLLMPDEQGKIFIERALKHGEGGPITLLVFTVISALGGGPWWGGGASGLRIGGYVVIAALIWWFLTRTEAGSDLMAGKPWTAPKGGPDAAGVPRPGVDPGATMSPGNAAAAAGTTLTHPAPPLTPKGTHVRTRSIGFAGGLLALGLAIVAGAVIFSVASAGDWTGNHVAVAVAGGLGVIGLALIVGGLAGRRSGWVNGLAWLGIWAVIFTSAIPAGLTQPWSAGDRAYTVTSLSDANHYQLGLGDLTVDLSRAELDKTDGVDHVSAALGMGDLVIVVPESTKVTVNAEGGLGELVATGSNQDIGKPRFDRDGAGWSETLTFGPRTGPDELVIDASVGVGQITIKTGATP